MVSLQLGAKLWLFCREKGSYSGLKVKIFSLPDFCKKFSVYFFGWWFGSISLGLWTENLPLDCLEMSGESVNLEQGMMGVGYDVDILAALKVRRFLNLTI